LEHDLQLLAITRVRLGVGDYFLYLPPTEQDLALIVGCLKDIDR
jgi:hypothetical protein